MAETYEQVLCVKHEVFVYRILARATNRGYRAAEWKLDEPDWTGRMKVVLKDKNLSLKLEDKNSGELFAECPVEDYPSVAIEQVLDSSRYFVIRIRDEGGRNAFIGIGFADRGDSFDLLVAIQDHFKHVKREEKQATEASEEAQDSLSGNEDRPKLDLSLKHGETIKLNLATKKNTEANNGASTRRLPSSSNSILLPPPPAPSKLAPPIKPPPTNSDLLFLLDTPLNPPTSNLPTHNPTPQNPPVNSSINPFGSDDVWQDFASAPVSNASQQAPVNWVNFD